MAEKFSGHLAGSEWQSKLLHVQYDGTKVRARHEFYNNLNFLIGENDDYSMHEFSPLKSKITEAKAFSIDLDVPEFKFTKKATKHHFVVMKTESGHIFTLEKTTDCILLQSGRILDARHLRNGEKRKKLDTLREICIEQTPKPISIVDLFSWINEVNDNGFNELTEPYHLVNSNCQHFAMHVWSDLSPKKYPNPGKFFSFSTKRGKKSSTVAQASDKISTTGRNDESSSAPPTSPLTANTPLNATTSHRSPLIAPVLPTSRDVMDVTSQQSLIQQTFQLTPSELLTSAESVVEPTSTLTNQHQSNRSSYQLYPITVTTTSGDDTNESTPLLLNHQLSVSPTSQQLPMIQPLSFPSEDSAVDITLLPSNHQQSVPPSSQTPSLMELFSPTFGTVAAKSTPKTTIQSVSSVLSTSQQLPFEPGKLVQPFVNNNAIKSTQQLTNQQPAVSSTSQLLPSDKIVLPTSRNNTPESTPQLINQQQSVTSTSQLPPLGELVQPTTRNNATESAPQLTDRQEKTNDANNNFISASGLSALPLNPKMVMELPGPQYTGSY